MSGRLAIRTYADMPSPSQVFTNGTLIPINDGFSFRLSLIENSIAEFELVRRQSGWRLLSAQGHRFASIVWLPTNAPAQILAIGRLAEIPGDLFSTTQTLRYLCAPLDIETRMLAFARENLDTQPEVDWLVAEASRSDPQAYLAGRSRVYRVDPVSHEVSTYDEIVGDRIVDLSDLAIADESRISDKPGIYDTPVQTLRTRVVADWTQETSGEVDIGALIPRIDCLDPNVGSNIDAHVVFRNGEGWSALGGQATTRRSGVRVVDVGAMYRLSRSYRTAKSVSVMSRQGGVQQDVLISDVFATKASDDGQVANDFVTTIRPALAFFTHRVQSFGLSYDYSQPRREILYAALGCPRIPFANGHSGDYREEPDFEVTLGEVFTDVSIDEYREGTAYKQGNLVRRVDRYYECLDDHTSNDFNQVRPGHQFDQTNRTYWKRFFPDIPTPATLVSFFDSERGKRFASHVLLRMRKEALRRLRLRHVVLTYRWQDAAHVRLQDSVRFIIPWGDGSLRPVVGKVFSIETTWDGISNPLIQIEVAVSFGQTDFVPEPVEASHELTFRMDASGAEEPVEAWRLVSSNYAAMSLQVVNDVGDQMNAVHAAVQAGQRPEDATVIAPTTIDVTLRSIQSKGTLEQEVDVYAFLDASPRGIAL